jgi:uncharacterized protein
MTTPGRVVSGSSPRGCCNPQKDPGGDYGLSITALFGEVLGGQRALGKRHLSFGIKIRGMPDTLELSLRQARRLAIRCQLLAGPPGVLPPATIDGMRQVLRALRCLQLDPVNVVARSHLLVLWSRLGSFGRDDLDTLLWRERWLFEYWAHAASIVLTEDYPIHSVMMRAYPGAASHRDWIVANDVLRRYVLEQLGESGPLPADAFEDRAVVSWQSTGWTNGRNVDRMLDALWKQGAIRVAGRDGLRRLWDVAGRDPAVESLTREEAVTLAASHALRALGVARARDIEQHFIRGRYAGLDMERASFARRVRVEGGTEDWWVHRDVFGLLEEEWVPRTALLSPFDNLICDRERTERLWGFTYRNEMYVPKAKRQYGCYVMPILSGDRLIGRIAPRADRRREMLVVEGVFAEPGAPHGAETAVSLAKTVESLSEFVGARSVEYAPAGDRLNPWSSVIR